MKIRDLFINERGQWAEKRAEQFLSRQGLKLVTRNYSCFRGEIDLIMTDKNDLIFVEVRYRKDQRFGGGIESIDSRKQKKLRITAMHYIQEHDKLQSHNYRFDAVIMTGPEQAPFFNWIKNAF